MSPSNPGALAILVAFITVCALLIILHAHDETNRIIAAIRELKRGEDGE